MALTSLLKGNPNAKVDQKAKTPANRPQLAANQEAADNGPLPEAQRHRGPEPKQIRDPSQGLSRA